MWRPSGPWTNCPTSWPGGSLSGLSAVTTGTPLPWGKWQTQEFLWDEPPHWPADQDQLPVMESPWGHNPFISIVNISEDIGKIGLDLILNSSKVILKLFLDFLLLAFGFVKSFIAYWLLVLTSLTLQTAEHWRREQGDFSSGKQFNV